METLRKLQQTTTHLIVQGLLSILRGYKRWISPALGSNCRFYPSCSDYAQEALQVHGMTKGVYLSAKRLCRCQPFSAGGVDPVPPCTASNTTSKATRIKLPRP